MYSPAGILLSTDLGFWLALPWHAVWVPPGVPCSARACGKRELHTALIGPDDGPANLGMCCVVAASPLFRELICALAAGSEASQNDVSAVLTRKLLVSKLAKLAPKPGYLAVPRDPRLVLIGRRVIENPGEDATVEDLSRLAGISARSVNRLFIDETGISVGKWRQRAKLMAAVQLLAAGESVATTALRLNYRPSAFAAMFKRALGVTPAAYAKGLHMLMPEIPR